ncbi:MAG: TadG family pilus assembly protein [Dyella sp.]
MAITMLLLLAGLALMLGLVEIGYLYWAKRDAQKIADLAALAGVQRLEQCTAGNDDNSAARGNAVSDNHSTDTLTIRCGNWATANPAIDHFAVATPPAPLNAVKVIVERPVLPFLGQNASLPTIKVSAVAAKATPIASFTVGPQLLRVNGHTPLGTLLQLVGVNLDNATVLGYDGLAQINVTPAGLLQALGIPFNANLSIADLNGLLSANKISLGQLLDASATLITQNGGTQNIEALRSALSTQLDLNLLDQPIQLGSNDSTGGLFAVISGPDGSGTSALQANLNLLDLISTGISIAAKGHAVAVNGLDILGLFKAQAAVVEPPSIGVGGVGTTAFNAQIRLFIDIDSNALLGGILSPLLRLNLPIYVDIVDGMGTLTAIDCGAQPATATVQVHASILRSCVGKIDPSVAFSSNDVCSSHLQNEPLLTLAGANLINTSIALNALNAPDQSLTLPAGATGSTQINPLLIGNTVSELVAQLLQVLGNLNSPPGGYTTPGNAATQLATTYLDATKGSNNRYNVAAAIALMSQPPGGNPGSLSGLGNWVVQNGVPYPCPPLGLKTCFKDGNVWDALSASVNGTGQGVVGGLLGTLAGGLLINNCSGLVAQLATYNSCVSNNLASYLQTAPQGVLQNNSGGGGCRGLLCLVIMPVIDLLTPYLNGLGTLLSNTLNDLLGIELGRTDVHMTSIQCQPAQLVF